MGEQFDQELGQYYLRDRYYDTKTGRFSRKDSFEGYLNDPMSRHGYTYGHGNPVNFTDPSGFTTLGETNAAEAIREAIMRIYTEFATKGMTIGEQRDSAGIKQLILDVVGDLAIDRAMALAPVILPAITGQASKWWGKAKAVDHATYKVFNQHQQFINQLTSEGLTSQQAAQWLDLAYEAGMRPGAFLAFRDIARQEGVSIRVRFTNPESPQLRNLGLSPKPIHVKQKTINQLDKYLHPGAAGNEGRVGLFEPTMPTREQVPSGLYDKIAERYKKRESEWKKYKDGNPGSGIPPYQLPENTDLDGILLVDKKPGSRYFGQHFTGDHDVFDIIDLKTGKVLGVDPSDSAGAIRSKEIIRKLQAVNSDQPRDVMHGGHMDWDWGGSPANPDAQASIRDGHTPPWMLPPNKRGDGFEPLIAFTGSGQVMKSHYYGYSKPVSVDW